MLLPDIVTLSGSTRTGSFNAALAAHIARRLDALGASAEALSLKDFPMPIYDGDLEQAEGVPETALALKRRIGAADGVVLVTPEYNAGIPPLLKNAIDWVSRITEEGDAPGSVWKERPTLLGAASPGALGGIRALLQLRQTMEVGLGAFVAPSWIMLPGAGGAFAEDGTLKPGRSADLMEAALAQFLRLVEAGSGLRTPR